MQIWVDADACPVAIKDIVLRAATRRQVKVIFVANQYLNLPESPYIEFKKVAPGFDVADDEIAQQVATDDLVITADIPLAAECIEKGAHALSPRGELYDPDTIGQRLNMRDFMDTMRATGIRTGGPPPLSKADRMTFANHFDRLVTRFADKP
ncbi:MAG: YaiI/YqxD family protein [Pseudomonadota bacterium]